MARSRKKKKHDSAKSDDAGEARSFHAPFAGLAKNLSRVRRAGASKREGDDAAGAAPAAPGSVAARTGQEAVEEDPFREAMRGARPLSASSRRVPAASTAASELPSVEARHREEVAERAECAFDVSYSDRYVRGSSAVVSRDTLAKLEAGRFSVRAHIDLHGMVVEEARREVDRFVAERQRRGDGCVLIITGKGRNSPRGHGVLWEEIPNWLARGPSARLVAAFVTARPADGGEGALYVLLRRNGSRKNHIAVQFGGVGALTR